MEIEIIAIGNKEKILEIVSDFIYSEKDGIFLVAVPKNLYKYTLSLFKSSNIQILEHSQYSKILNSVSIDNPISKLDSEKYFD